MGVPLIMFPSSAVQVIEQTGDRLVVVNPPYYVVGWCLILLALIMIGFRCFVSGANLWPGLFIAAPFLIAGLGMLTSSTTFSFSRSGVVTVDRRTFGISRSTKQLRLQDIRSATVETGRNSRRLILVLTSGSVIPMGSLTSQQGNYKAASSINNFLKLQGSQESANHRKSSPMILPGFSGEEWTVQALYEELYCARGDMENRIKEQFSLFADRVSAKTMRANQMRLYLSTAAYVSGDRLAPPGIDGDGVGASAGFHNPHEATNDRRADPGDGAQGLGFDGIRLSLAGTLSAVKAK